MNEELTPARLANLEARDIAVTKIRQTLASEYLLCSGSLEDIYETIRRLAKTCSMKPLHETTPEEPPTPSVEELRKKSKAFDNFVVNEMSKTPILKPMESAELGQEFLDYSGSANEKQIGGKHYKITIEPWDFILANNLGFLEGNAIKYIVRHRQKNGIQDISKAIHYLEKLKEHELERLERETK